MNKQAKGITILSILIVFVILMLKFVDVEQILKDKIKDNVNQEVEKIKYKVDSHKQEIRKKQYH